MNTQSVATAATVAQPCSARPHLNPVQPPGPVSSSASNAEADLIRRAQQGDQAAFATLIAAHQGALHARAMHYLADADDAADVVQDVILRAFQAIGRTRPGLLLAAWLSTITANRCRDLLRRRRRVRWLRWEEARHGHLCLSGPADDPERAALSQEARRAVWRVLARLTPRHRLALLLREADDLGCQAIADHLGLSRSAVKSLLCRARQDFRRTATDLETADMATPVTPTPTTNATTIADRTGRPRVTVVGREARP